MGFGRKYLLGILFAVFIFPLYASNFNLSALALSKTNERSEYILGPGDILNLEVFDSKIFSSKLLVFSDGTVSLPLLGSLQIEGLNIDSAKHTIKKKLETQLLRPEFKLTLLKMRPLRVSIIGEINKPGIYTFPMAQIDNEINSSYRGIPTVVDAIKKAGGINPKANLKNVLLTRYISTENKDIIQKQTKLDIFDLVSSGNQSYNLYLFDGDIINVNKTNKSLDKISKISTSNLLPDKINVYVVGEVKNPGKQTVDSNITLNQAILASGGIIENRASKSSVKLIRLNNDGNFDYKSLKLDLNNNLQSINNPLLIEGDTILVKTNSGARFSDSLGLYSTPISGIVNMMNLYKLFD